MTTTTPTGAAFRGPLPARPRATGPDVDVVVPVHNEEVGLERSLRRLHAHLDGGFPLTWRVTIADNASTDATWAIAQRLAATLPGVRAVHLDEKGRGGALHEVWSRSDAAVLAYMDVDLSTDLAALLPLVAPLLSGHSDVAIGSRLARSARVVRGPRRELISRCYNLLLRAALGARFSDAQCGFKAVRSDRARGLLPLVEDTGWFFDTELLVLAERAGLRIHEVPVDWVDDTDSRVDVVATALDDLRGIVRLGRGPVAGRVPQLVRFAAIGVASTVAYAVLFWVLRSTLSAQVANLVALLLTAVANTAANRRLTFGVSGPAGRLRHLGQGLVVFAIGLALTSGCLAVLHLLDPTPARVVELGVLVLANVAATLIRFVLLRAWVFPTAAPAPATVPAPRSVR